MKISLIFVVSVIFIFSINSVSAQQIRIKIDKPFVSKQLSGKVVTLDGNNLIGVSVKRYSSGWKKLIDSTLTDKNGKFSFPNLPEGKYFLLLSCSGFQQLEIKVILTKKSKGILKIELPVAT